MKRKILRIPILLFINLIVLIGILPKIALAAPPVPVGSPSPIPSAAPGISSTGTWYNQSFPEFFTKVYDPYFSTSNEIFGERYTAAQVQWVIYSLFSFIITGGQNGNAEAFSCVISKDASQCVDAIKKLLTANTLPNNNSFLAAVTSNPVSGVGYVKELVTKFRIVPEAQAQTGFGYTQNNFVIDLWKISRNISYALLVVAVIIMSFMIMFRVKISPQVVISIQSALPKIIGALILITFSYAIAGFLIDLMYVVIGLLATILTTNWGGAGACGDPGTLRLSCWNWQDMFKNLTQKDMFSVLLAYWKAFIVTAFANILSGGVIYGLIFICLALFSIIILLWYSIKILILMFKTFLNIVIAIITAPFSILLGTVMQGAGFGPWLRNIISNLMVYPVVGAMIFFANFFLRIAADTWWTSAGFDHNASEFWLNPQMLVSQNDWWKPPLTTGVSSGAIFSLQGILLMAASWTIISMIPKAAELVKSIMAGKEFAGGGSGIGEVASGVRVVGGGIAEGSDAITKAGIFDKSPKIDKFVQDLGRVGKWSQFLPRNH